MDLRIFIHGGDNILNNLYTNSANLHNSKMNSSSFPDAGFDLFAPVEMHCFGYNVTKINFGVSCSARIVCENGKSFNTGFFMYPRSSLSGTPLRLANSVGVIDSGYRGDAGIKLYNLTDTDYDIKAGDRIAQFVMYFNLGMQIEWGTVETTDRGDKGFGSSGK
jgi:dUTP pyrophosphatase